MHLDKSVSDNEIRIDGMKMFDKTKRNAKLAATWFIVEITCKSFSEKIWVHASYSLFYKEMQTFNLINILTS